jgi:cytochrome b561
MTTAKGAPAPASQRDAVSARYTTPILVAHWTTAMLVLGLFIAGWSVGLAKDADTARRLITLHRSLGVIVWGLTFARMGWRLVGEPAPTLPTSLPPLAKLAARLNEYALYGLLLIQPVTGALQTLYRGKPFGLFTSTIPALVARDKGLAGLFHGIHEWGAWLLAGLIALHACAALVHALVLRDGVFQHMAPIRRKRPL